MRKCPLGKIIVSFVFWLIFLFTEHVLLDIFGICFEGVRDWVRDSLLIIICCHIILVVFGEEPFFGPICILCQHFLDLFCFVFVFCLFWVLLLFGI